MLQPIFDFIEKLATEFSWKKIVSLLFMVLVLSVSWLAYEAQTSTNQLTKYERTVAIIEKLETLSLSDPKSQKIAENVYQGLESLTKANEYQLALINDISLEARQALWSAIPWLIFTLFYIPSALRGETEARNSIYALIFLSLLIGGIGYFVPIKWGTWMYPLVGNFLFLLILAWYGNRINAK